MSRRTHLARVKFIYKGKKGEREKGNEGEKGRMEERKELFY